MVNYEDNINDIEMAIRKALKNSLKDAADAIVEKAVERCPVKTGDLQRSIFAGEVMDEGSGASIKFGVSSAHAGVVEWGSAGRGEPFVLANDVDYDFWPMMPPGKKTFGPYSIRPRRGSVLHWRNAQGEDVFARSVKHPGIAPKPFLRPAIDEIRLGGFKSIVEANIKKELRRFTQ